MGRLQKALVRLDCQGIGFAPNRLEARAVVCPTTDSRVRHKKVKHQSSVTSRLPKRRRVANKPIARKARHAGVHRPRSAYVTRISPPSPTELTDHSASPQSNAHASGLRGYHFALTAPSLVVLEDLLAHNVRPDEWQDCTQCVQGTDPFVTVEGPDVLARMADADSKATVADCESIDNRELNHAIGQEGFTSQEVELAEETKHRTQDFESGIAEEDLRLHVWENDGGYCDGCVIESDITTNRELCDSAAAPSRTREPDFDVEASIPVEFPLKPICEDEVEEKAELTSTSPEDNSGLDKWPDFDVSSKYLLRSTDEANAAAIELTEFERCVNENLRVGEVKDAYDRLANSVGKSLPPKDSQVLTFLANEKEIDYTNVVAHLANQLAANHETRVLLVDGDMVSSTLSNRLQVAEALGLFDILNDGTSATEAIQSRFHGNVDFLPAGRGSLPYVDFPRLASLVVQWRRSYRYVLIDGGGQVDSRAESLMEASEASYLLVRLGVTPLQRAQRTLRRIQPILKERLGCIAMGDMGASSCVDFL